MSVNPFRSIGSRAAALATAGVLGMGALGIFPAAAQQVSAAPGSPACVGIKDHLQAIKCEIRQSEIRTEQSRLRTNEVGLLQGCADFLKKGIASGDIVQAKVLEIAGGQVTEKNVCDVARGLGYGRKAELSPAVN